MSEQEQHREKAWQFVHGEMPSDERARLLRDLKQVPDMDRELHRARRMDRLLRTLLPAASRTDEELEAEILQAWEREHRPAAAAPSWSEQLWSWMGSWQPALAVASVALLILGATGALYYTLRLPGDVVWDRVIWLSADSRGTGEEPVAGGDPATEAALREAVGAALKDASRGSPRGARVSEAWTLSAVLTATDAGALHVRFTAQPRQPGLAPLTWSSVLPAQADQLPGAARALAATMERDMRSALAAAADTHRE